MAALLLMLGGVWLFVIAGTQVAWSAAENDLCERAGSQGSKLSPIGVGKKFFFASSETCVSPRLWVERGRRYEITFEEREPWSDGGEPTSPLGLGAFNLGPAGVIGAPLRRIVDADYLQPLYEIRPEDSPRVPRVLLRSLTLFRDDRPFQRDPTNRLFTAIISPSESGELFLFSNDAAIFGWRRMFYSNNCGTALVTIRDMDAAAPVGSPAPDPPAPSLRKWCVKAL